MAIETVNLADSTIKINAKANAATVATLACLIGELTFSKGERDVTEEECHTGTQSFTGVKKYPDGTFSITYDSANADAAQTMLQAALDHTGDFANDNTMELEVEFNNSKGTNGAKLKMPMLVTGFTITAAATGASKVECKFKQTGDYSAEAAA